MAVATRSLPRQKDPLIELRALLGQVRSKGFKVDDRRRAFTYRTGLQRVLMTARLSTARASPHTFFDLLQAMTQVDARRFERQPIGHDYLLQLLEGDPLPLDQEIRWTSARIWFERRVLSEFIDLSLKLQDLFVAEDYAACLGLLQECDERLGVSLWSTELRMGLTQRAHGHEAQKEVLKEIKAVRRKGMWPYVANSASVRAEASVSISWFLDETRRRQERLKRNEFTDYLKFRGSGAWPESHAACARILRTEQSHHIIDVYETFISYLQEAATRGATGDVGDAITSSLNELRSFPDSRLSKVRFAITGNLSDEVAVTPEGLIDTFIGDASNFTQPGKFVRKTFRSSTTPERVFALSLAASRTTLANEEGSSDKIVAVRGLAEALRRTGYQSVAAARADEKLKKYVHVFGAIPYAKALRCILEASSSSHTSNAITRLRLASLNSRDWGALDLLGCAGSNGYEVLRARSTDSPIRTLADLLAGLADREDGLRHDVASLARSTHLYLSAKSDAAATSVERALVSDDRIVAAQAATVALNAYARTGAISEASGLIAREHVDYGVDPEAMPVREVYEELEWRDLSSAASEPQLSIALSLIESTEGDDKIRTYRRFALETLLSKFDISKPSELRNVETGWPHSHLVFFLSRVCTAAMLDMLPVIRSTREVLEERRDICGYLATVDRDNSEAHAQEVLGISRELTVLDGLRTIDGSRVHVDTESLSRRLKIDLAESFQRYVALLKNTDETVEGLSTILKDVGRRDHTPDYLLAMPVSEPDELLVSMIVRSRERFLFDVPHGLDSYLSKRIRHGSIVGVLRAPAEREGVIAKRNLNGSYRPNGTWADTIADGAQRSALTAAIVGASKAIDAHLLRIKDTLLHVRSESKPHGLFDAPLTTPSYLIIRSFASADASLESFVDTMFKSLWGMLGPSLAHAQGLLRRDSVAFVSEQFQSLRAKASRILKNPEDRAAFDAAVVKASVGVQAALVTAASWFEPAEPVSRSYSLEEVVAIALESVRATTAKFSPDLELTSNSTFSFSDLALPLVCDVFYIAFGNIAAHGDKDGEQTIRIAVNRDQEARFLTFEIENEMSISEAELARMTEKLETIRGEIAASQGEARARSEGGSGLHKLASIVAQVEGDSMSFSCSRDRFILQLRLGYSPERPF